MYQPIFSSKILYRNFQKAFNGIFVFEMWTTDHGDIIVLCCPYWTLGKRLEWIFHYLHIPPKSHNSSCLLWNSDFGHWWVEFCYLESKISSSENIFLWHNKSTTQHTLWQVYSVCFQSRQHCVSCVGLESFVAGIGQNNYKFWPDLDLWWFFKHCASFHIFQKRCS